MPSSGNPWITPSRREAMMHGIRAYVERGNEARRDPARLAGVLADNSMPEPNSGCLLWLLGTTSDGYGRMVVNKKTVLTHRLAYELAKGPIPAGLAVCHKCDVPGCINPEHLWVGTLAENTADMDAKGRRGTTVGQACRRSKLTAEQVLEIRKDGRSYSVIGKSYGVTKNTVYEIKSRRKWRHI